MQRGDWRKRWGVILAGGDGVRLRSLTRFICGDERPKQFCPLYGGATLVEHARHRALRSIPDSQLLFSLNQAHEEFYLRVLADCPSQRIVQPFNRGTTPAIFSSLLVVAQNDPTASVAVFPSDHYYSDESIFTQALECAFDLARFEPDSIVLVGARPDAPEVDYGWIETGAPVRRSQDSFRVRGFLEKPSKQMAQFLLEQSSLWNTFVMVGRALTFVETVCTAVPGLLKAFQKSPPMRCTPNEEIRIADSIYASMPSTDFSRKVLSPESRRLIVHRLGPTTWSDLGDCDRATAAVSHGVVEPEWLKNWRAERFVPAFPVDSVPAVA
jgi:mannose-1-phosphate guanylyltransferase